MIRSNRSVISAWSSRSLGLSPQSMNDVEGPGVGRTLELVLPEHGPERAVHRILAEPLLKQVHGQRALAVVDILLVLHPAERKLLDHLIDAVAQIIVELEFQEAPDRILSVKLLHHHQRGILRQGLDEQGATLHFGAGDLVAPILVGQLMGGDIGRIVDLLRIPEISREPEGL